MNLLRLLTLMGAALLVTYILITAASIHEGPLSFEPVGKSSFRTLASGATVRLCAGAFPRLYLCCLHVFHSVCVCPRAVSPPTRQELGRATWTLLHKMAAMYPKEPTEANKRDAAAFFDAFSQMYPCDECAGHFRCGRVHSSLWLIRWSMRSCCSAHCACACAGRCWRSTRRISPPTPR